MKKKAGHPGRGRKKPAEVDRQETHTLDECPHCTGPVRPVKDHHGKLKVRMRYIEDIVVADPECVGHGVGQYWCRSCARRVEPAVTAALPGARLGLQAVVRTAIQHYQLGIPATKIVRLLREGHGFDVTAGGLTLAWRRLANFLAPDYEEFRAAALSRGVLHADETGWRVNGARLWLWVFCTKQEALYLVDRSRGGEVARAVLGEGFDGVLVRDFYSAYERCQVAGTQYCLAHLLRDSLQMSEGPEEQPMEVGLGGTQSRGASTTTTPVTILVPTRHRMSALTTAVSFAARGAIKPAT